jgi:hypothetical protein
MHGCIVVYVHRALDSLSYAKLLPNSADVGAAHKPLRCAAQASGLGSEKGDNGGGSSARTP